MVQADGTGIGVVYIHGRGASPRAAAAGPSSRPWNSTASPWPPHHTVVRTARGGAVDVTTRRIEVLSPADQARTEALHKRGAVWRLRQPNHDQLDRARRLIKAGRGRETTSFVLANMGNSGRYTYVIHTTPEIYFSYNDPKGMRAMSLTAARHLCYGSTTIKASCAGRAGATASTGPVPSRDATWSLT